MLFYRRRTLTTTVAEIAIAVAGIAASRFVDSPESIAAGVATVPNFWPAGSVLGAAVLLGVRGGILAAVVIGLADLVAVGFVPTAATLHNIVLLLLLGGLFGLAVDLAREGQQRLEAVLAEQERLKERERLSRAVHDGVLQALAYINRRGAQLGPEGAELAALAAEQERSLRELITTSHGGSLAKGTNDLRAGLLSLEAERVSVVTPAEPVVVPRVVADEVVAAVEAALDNVSRHAGPDAQAWVLLEGSRDALRVTVRDTGVGMEPGRLAEAAAQGRLGASAAIRSRVEDLGGTVTWRTRPGGGCTVVMDLPRAGLTSQPAHRDRVSG
jgi:signal transduction histidine kinase